VINEQGRIQGGRADSSNGVSLEIFERGLFGMSPGGELPQDFANHLLYSTVPGLKAAKSLDDSLKNLSLEWQDSSAYRFLQHVGCQFSFDPYCGKLGN
jgi:hypothetical protein